MALKVCLFLNETDGDKLWVPCGADLYSCFGGIVKKYILCLFILLNLKVLVLGLWR